MTPDTVPSLVIQGLLADLAAREAESVTLRHQLDDAVAETDSLRETLQASVFLLRDVSHRYSASHAAVTALRREIARYTREQVTR